MPGRLSSILPQEPIAANAARTARAIRIRRIAAAPRRTVAAPTRTMSFQLSPYDTVLDLSKNEDSKLHLKASKGLKEDNLFTGKKTDFDKFSKLIGKVLKDVRVMEVLVILTEWDTTNANAALQRILTEAGLLNLFEDSKVTKEQVKVKSGLVWSDSKVGATTPAYFKRFDVTPTDDAILNAVWNHAKMKHVIMGKKTLSSQFREQRREI